MTVPSLFQQLLSASASAAQARAEAEKPAWPLNPFPRGMREGCCTQRVLEELKKSYPRHMEHGQLRMNLKASRGMVTWALRYLEAHGLVQRLHDPRNPSFRRWRAVVPAPTFQIP
jgi:hypothetical protein